MFGHLEILENSKEINVEFRKQSIVMHFRGFGSLKVVFGHLEIPENSKEINFELGK